MAWFAMAARLNLPMTVYGNGKQVRDLLHVDDLVELYLAAAGDRATGSAGGQHRRRAPGFRLPEGALALEKKLGRRSRPPGADPPGTSPSYCNVERVGAARGVDRLLSWIRAAGRRSRRFLARGLVVGCWWTSRIVPRRARAILLGLLLVGAFFRFQGLAWDAGHHLHPDERFISMVEEKIAFPKSVGDYFDSKRSTLNPYNRGEGSFVYGSLPMVLAKAVAQPLGKAGYDGTYRVGRALSGVFDLLTVWLVYRITRRFTNRRAALLSAGLMAFCVLGIQLSHFWAVDTYLTTFSAAALLGAVRIAQGRSGRGSDALTGMALGLAVACKITALALLLPLGLAVLVRLLREGKPFGPAFGRAVLRGVLILVPAALVVRVFLPYVFLGPGVFSFRLDPRWVEDLKRISQLSKSVAGFPPALQWAGRTLFFPFENFVLWGAGVFFGISALLAVAWSVAAIVRRRAFDLAPLLFYVLFLFGYHGLTMVKSVRYFYPAYPGLAVLTGVLFSSLLTGSRAPRLWRAVALGVLGGTFLWALAFTSIYRRPQTRVAATNWIYTHVPAHKAIVNESWDDGLPLPKPGYDPGSYAGPQAMPLFDPDSPQKADLVVRALTEADWVAVTSNRVYGNVTRVPSVFPMSIAYYRGLFDGSLGFERAADFTSYPSLGPLRFPDDGAEEQFTVYDHPRVLLFRKTAKFSATETRRVLLAAMPKTPPTMNDWERWPRALRRVSAPVRPDHRAEIERAAPSVEPTETAANLLGRRSSGTSRCCSSAPPPCRSRGRSFRASTTAASGSRACSASCSRPTR